MPNDDRSVWKSGDMSIVVNPASTDEQVLMLIENLITQPPPPKSDAERIAELEAQLAALIATLNKPS